MPLYTIRIFKAWGARDADRRWSNTYEVLAAAESPDVLLTPLAGLVAAEKKLHIDDVQFLSATVSTWEAEAVDYDPFSFATLELSGTGEYTTSAGPEVTSLDTNVALMVQFSPTTGRSGRRFYRGVLQEQDVMMGGDGHATFDPAGPFMGAGRWTNFTTALAPYIGGGAGEFKIGLISQAVDGPAFRPVVTVNRGKVAVNKRNHRYFDLG